MMAGFGAHNIDAWAKELKRRLSPRTPDTAAWWRWKGHRATLAFESRKSLVLENMTVMSDIHVKITLRSHSYHP